VARPLVALATSAEWPELDDDGRLLVAALDHLGVDAGPARWDDESADWARYDLVVVRCTFDYVDRRGDFLAWTASVPRLANPGPVLRWNTDKRYLADLAAAGVPVVPTTWLEPGQAVAVPAGGCVVKPAVGLGSRDAARHPPGDEAAALDHVRRLHEAGQVAMVQPYLAGVDAVGETDLVFLGGVYSHAMRKAASLTDGVAPPGLPAVEPRRATPAEVELAVRALGAVPGNPPLLYGRVDVVPGADGHPVVLEVELTEPWLALAYEDGSADRFAAAITRWAGGLR